MINFTNSVCLADEFELFQINFFPSSRSFSWKKTVHHSGSVESGNIVDDEDAQKLYDLVKLFSDPNGKIVAALWGAYCLARTPGVL